MRSILLTFRFVLEIALLAGIAIGAAETVGGVIGWIAGVALAVVVALIWGTFVSPKAPHRLSVSPRIVLELALFAAASALLVAAGHIASGAALIVLYAINIAAITLLGVTEDDFSGG